MKKTRFHAILRVLLGVHLLAFLVVTPGCSTRTLKTDYVRGELISSEKSGPIVEKKLLLEQIDPYTVSISEQIDEKYRISGKYNKLLVEKKGTAGFGILGWSFFLMGLPIMMLSYAIMNAEDHAKSEEKIHSECKPDNYSFHIMGWWYCATTEDQTIIPNEFYQNTVDTDIKSYNRTAQGYADIIAKNRFTGSIIDRKKLTIDSQGKVFFDKNTLTDKVSIGDKVDLVWTYGDKTLTTIVPSQDIVQLISSRTPPQLTIAAREIKFEGGMKTGSLKGEDAGAIVLTVANTDKKGTAWGVNLTVSGNECVEVNYAKGIAIGDLRPGERKLIRIPVNAGLETTDCKLNLTVQAKEKFGQDSKKVKIPAIAIKAVDRPDLAVTAITHSAIPQNGRSLDLTASVTNNGVGEAKGVVVKLGDLPLGVTPSWTTQNIGDMPPHSVQKVPLTLRFDKLFGGDLKTVDLAMTVADARPIARPSTKRYSMEYRFNSPTMKIADIQYFDGNDPDGQSEGNSNGQIEQDERIVAKVRVVNTGSLAAENVQVSLISDKPSSKLMIQPSEPQVIGALQPGEEKAVDFKFKVPVSLDPGPVTFTVNASESAFSKKVAELSRKTIYEAGTVEGSVAVADAKTPPKTTRSRVPGAENIDEVPSAGYKREDAYALVIGIGRYNVRGIKALPFAKNDAQAMREYLTNIGGVPRDNIRILTDEQATFTRINKELGWIRRNATDKSHVFIYYSGHGVADGAHNPYLLPHDGEPSSIEEMGFSIAQLKKEINKFKTKNVLVALDACYTGEGRSGSIKGQRGAAWAEDDPTPTEAVIINSSTLKEASWDYDKKQHGLFTYFLLKGMRGAAPDLNGDGFVDAHELYDYLKKEVPLASAKYCQASQSPVIQGNGKGLTVSKRIE